MESSSSEGDFVVLFLLKKRKRKRKYQVHLMLRLRREEGEFHVKELRDYPERFKVEADIFSGMGWETKSLRIT